ncbi:MAG TPA: type II/IV secretion system protein, partial [Candidatus Cloacimonadota bacterium]|nr:type II/IV secretion system protein [Candidatus Cloacimonadota bacterium]
MASLTKFGNYLVNNDYFDLASVTAASAKLDEYGDNSPSALARILVSDYKANADIVYEALARHYAFPKLDLNLEDIDSSQSAEIKELLNTIPEDFRKKLLYHKVFPYKLNLGTREILQVIASDTTDKLIAEIPNQTPYKRVEVYWCKLKTIEDLIQRIAPQRNEFLQLLEEAGEILVEDSSDSELNEQALDEEINKSLLVNLFEGVLIEAVRTDSS